MIKKWYWIVYLIGMIVCFVKWFSPAMLLAFCVLALFILLSEKREPIPIYTVYADDDDEKDQKEKLNEK